MEKYSEDIVRMIRLYLLGEVTAQESRRLHDWCARDEKNRLFFDSIRNDKTVADEFLLYEKIDDEKALKRFEHNIRKPSLYKRLWKYAAVIIFLVGICAIWQLKRNTPENVQLSKATSVISPGASKATLVLSNGKRIFLQQNLEREIPVNGEVMAAQHHDRLVYDSLVGEKVNRAVYNTLEIPRGGEYKLILADGTKIYLNSATTLRYPIAFTGKERKVYLSGEAYFEVTKNAEHPFLVEAEGTEIRVYGTSFNVNTFQEVKTVLVQGSVGLRSLKSGEETRIKPGQLALSSQSGRIRVCEVDTNLYTGWKDGLFCFENWRLEDIMSTLSNWYDVSVFFQSPDVKELHFYGFMKRYEEINVILEAIHEATGVKFRISGKTITISE